MENVIIYMQDNGILAVVVPAPEAISLYGLKFIAEKDVPAGRPYKIIPLSEVPEDRTFRNAWEVDEALLTDGIGADYGAGSDWNVAAIDGVNMLLVNPKTSEQKVEELPL